MTEDFEKILTNVFLRDESTLIMMLSSFQEKHFDNPEIGKIYNFTKDYYLKFHNLPDIDIVKSNLSDDGKDVLNEVCSIEIDLVKSHDWIEEQSDEFIKRKSLQHAIIDSVELVDKGKFGEVEKKVQDALLAGTKVDLGLAYFKDIESRALRLYKFKDRRLQTGFAMLDKVTNGGLIVPSLSVVLGKINLGKSLFLSNLALNIVKQGKNVAIITLEIAEDLLAQRIDGHLTGYDLNEIYQDKKKIAKLVQKATTKRKKGYGEIYIKEYPPVTISVADIRTYLRELDIRKMKYDAILIDYLTLMKSFTVDKENLYSSGKSIAEELRALSYYKKCPVVSVAQLNREGVMASFEDLDMHHTGESMGIIATADFTAIIGKNEEEMVYKSEISWKVIKNRMGRPGDIWKTFLNQHSLRLYDTIDDFTKSYEISGGNPEIN